MGCWTRFKPRHWIASPPIDREQVRIHLASSGTGREASHANADEHVFHPEVAGSLLYPIIARATRKDPDQRYPDALSMRRDLEQLELRLSYPGMPAGSAEPAPQSWSPQSPAPSGPVGWSGPLQTPPPIAHSAATPQLTPAPPSMAPVQDQARRGATGGAWRLAVTAVVLVAVGGGLYLAFGPESEPESTETSFPTAAATNESEKTAVVDGAPPRDEAAAANLRLGRGGARTRTRT